ncbi:MAG: Na+/H+ antiporter subunit E [Bacteroidales bacterium]
MRLKNAAYLFVILLIFWILLTNTLKLEFLIPGLILIVGIIVIFCRHCHIFSEAKTTPKAFGYTLLYIAVFLWELFKSNLDVARRVISPRLPINPGIIEAKTRIKSKMGRMILANSITLTPGTFTVDIIDDTFYIHSIDIKEGQTEEMSINIIRRFEKYLEEIYD